MFSPTNKKETKIINRIRGENRAISTDTTEIKRY